MALKMVGSFVLQSYGYLWLYLSSFSRTPSLCKASMTAAVPSFSTARPAHQELLSTTGAQPCLQLECPLAHHFAFAAFAAADNARGRYHTGIDLTQLGHQLTMEGAGLLCEDASIVHRGRDGQIVPQADLHGMPHTCVTAPHCAVQICLQSILHLALSGRAIKDQ